MRADRLVATLLLMQARGRVTAAEVADELEVSVATARRDLEALSTAGIPVYPQPGRGGGWSLVGGARTDLTGLTSSEAQALFLLVGSSSDRSADATSALRKLVRALPATFRAEAEAAGRAVVVDPVGWGSAARSRQPWVEELQSAVVRRRQVTVTYSGRNGESERTVDPWALVDKGDLWYLVAGTPAGRRTFRLDRILALEVLDTPAPRPDDLDVAAIWESVVDEVEQRRGRVTATVLTTPFLVRVVRDQFGGTSPSSVLRTTAACAWRSRRTPRARSPRSSPGSGRRWRCSSPRRSGRAGGAGRRAGRPVCRWWSLACRA